MIPCFASQMSQRLHEIPSHRARLVHLKRAKCPPAQNVMEFSTRHVHRLFIFERWVSYNICHETGNKLFSRGPLAIFRDNPISLSDKKSVNRMREIWKKMGTLHDMPLTVTYLSWGTRCSTFCASFFSMTNFGWSQTFRVTVFNSAHLSVMVGKTFYQSIRFSFRPGFKSVEVT